MEGGKYNERRENKNGSRSRHPKKSYPPDNFFSLERYNILNKKKNK